MEDVSIVIQEVGCLLEGVILGNERCAGLLSH